MSRTPTTPSPKKRRAGFLDQTLRPSRWDDYIGQKNIKDNLHILLTAAKEREHPPEHILFYGPPGLGKTTLAHLIAKETGAQMKVTSGPAILKVGDLASVLTNLSAGDILFIDEIHGSTKLSKRSSTLPWRPGRSISSSAKARLRAPSSSICRLYPDRRDHADRHDLGASALAFLGRRLQARVLFQ
jgi:hypothetical protein